MSNNYYFSHDYNARNDVKLQKVLKELGLEGIGLYWCLVEMLYENGGVLELSECDSYAFALRTDTTKVLQIIDLVFEKKQSTFTSASVMRRLKERIQKSKKASKSANKRWEKEYAKAMRSHSDRNATNQTKPNKNISINTNTSNDGKQTNHGNEHVNLVLETFKQLYGFYPTDKKPRFIANTLVKQIITLQKKRGKHIPGQSESAGIKGYFTWIGKQDGYEKIESLDTLRRKITKFEAHLGEPNGK
jgi:uncharacterized protein YdaU (DUF1376 family)